MTVSIDLSNPELVNNFKESVNAPQNAVKYISIDPGKANGVCLYDEKMYLRFPLTIPADDMVIFLQLFDAVDKCIIEDYRIYSHKAKQHINSDVETLRVIGRVEAWADNKKVTLIKQPATIKKTGYAWLGEAPPKKSNPLNHQMDANCHFIFWAISKGFMSTDRLPKLRPR